MIYLIFFAILAAIWFTTSCKSNNSKGNPDVENSNMSDNGFTQKNDTVWFYDVPLKDVDAISFEIIDDYFFKDKHQIYFYETYRVSEDYFTSKRKRVVTLENVDPISFQSLGEGYAKDKSTAWNLSEAFQVADLGSLTILNHHFLKDIKTALAAEPMGRFARQFLVFSLAKGNSNHKANCNIHLGRFDHGSSV